MGAGHPWFNDAFLLRFCRARKFDFDKIVIMWTNFMDYRKQHDIDNIIENFEKEKDPYYE